MHVKEAKALFPNHDKHADTRGRRHRFIGRGDYLAAAGGIKPGRQSHYLF